MVCLRHAPEGGLARLRQAVPLLMLYGPHGGLVEAAPAPNGFTERRVNAELKRLDELLSIRWMETAYWNADKSRWEGRYALTCQWPSSDPRWKLYRKGDIGAPFDIMGWFCEDMHDVNSVPQDPESMLTKVLELLASCDNTRQSWRERMRQTIENNEKRHHKAVAEAGDMAEQEARRYLRMKNAVPVDGLKEASSG